MSNVPVLIVGGGPVGLALALDLGWRGVPVRLIEKGDGAIPFPKMGLMNVRTLEIARRWGIAEWIRSGGFPDDYGLSMTFCTAVFGHFLSQQEYPAMRDTYPPPSSPERRQRGSQMWFDPLLAKAARRYPHVELSYKTELVDFHVTPAGVRATIVDTPSGARSEVHARYLVGCDGAGSGVRRALGIEMEGTANLSYSVGIFFRSRELYETNTFGDTERFIFIGPNGTWGNLTAIDGRELWRLTVVGSKDKPIDSATLDVEAELLRAAGRPFAHEVLSVMPWRRSELVATAYGQPPVFLAGDAVHTMSPTGGHGMNTGIVDIADLSWKLAATIEGWGGDELLSTYDSERRPVGVRNVRAATAGFRVMLSAAGTTAILDETPEGEATRRRVGQEIREATLIEWESLGIQLGYRYAESPIIVPDGTAQPPDDHIEYVPSARPGSRAPHVYLADGRSTLDLFGTGFTLLVFVEPGPLLETFTNAAAQRGVPLRVERIDEPEAARVYEYGYVLVRPDGHVAWRSNALPEEPMLIIDRVRGALGARVQSVS
jgi:2-polyprenyl-6-methoxyphenol hydroxylase-like FAD-dependent oxidoreductase